MSDDAGEGSVTRHLRQFVRDGDERAFEELWARYFERLVAVAEAKLRSAVVSGEDAALAAFQSFHRRARLDQFPRLEDRNDLWMVLETLVRQKVIDHWRHEDAVIHGGGVTIQPASELDGALERGRAVTGGEPEPDPAVAASLVDLMRVWMERLGSDELRAIARLKLEGHTDREVAERRGISVETVQRKTKLIEAVLKELTT